MRGCSLLQDIRTSDCGWTHEISGTARRQGLDQAPPDLGVVEDVVAAQGTLLCLAHLPDLAVGGRRELQRWSSWSECTGWQMPMTGVNPEQGAS